MTKEQRELYDYFEHFWDDLKKKAPKKPKERDAGKEMANFLRELDFSFHPLKSKEEKQKNYIRGSGSAKSQNCILKMHYVQDKHKHLAFLTEYMTQLDKNDIDEKPFLFSDIEVDKTFFDSYQKIMADLHFRFIISPESQDVDLHVAAKVFIEKLNSLYGYQLNWVGCIHKNTNHRHAHILINGVDKNGRNVRFPKSFVKETGRMMVQNICTGLVGFRTSKELLQKKEQEPFLERFTSIDEELLSIEKKLGMQKEHFSTFVLTRTEKQNERCEKLVELGLAKKIQSKENCFWLENNWNEKLRILGKVNVYKKARANMKLVHPGNLELWDDTKPEMDGIVTQLLYKNDEENWINAVVVENARLQKAYLIPFPGEMPDYRVYTQFVHCGKFISKKGRRYPKLQVYRGKQMKENNEIYNRQLRVRLPDNIWGQIEIYSKATNRSVNNVIRVAVEEYLSKNTQNETLFLEAMHKMTESFKQLADLEKETAELVSSVHDSLDSIESGLNKTEYESRIQIVLFLDFLRHSYSLFRKEVDSKNRTQQDMEASINFMNDYLQEFVAFRNKYGNNFFKKALDAKS